MITDRAGDRLSSQMDKHYQQMNLDHLIVRYKSFLEQKGLNNSFYQAEQFLKEMHISEVYLKALGVKSRTCLVIKITNTSLPAWY